MPYKACMICDSTSGEMKTVLESLIPTVASRTTAVEDVWDIFAEILTTFEDDSLNQICTDCFEEIQRTYSFIEKCERSKSNLMEVVLIKDETDIKQSKESDEINSEYEPPPNDDGKLSMEIKRSKSFEEYVIRNIENENVPLIEQDIKVDNELNIEMDERDLNGIGNSNDEADEVLWSLTVVSEENERSENCENDLNFSMNGNNTAPQIDELNGLHCPEDIPIINEPINMDYPDYITSKKPTIDYSSNKIHQFNDLNTAPELTPLRVSYEIDASAQSLKWKRVKDGFRCLVCSKVLTRKPHILRHMKLHSNSFSCRICLQTFRRKDYVKVHFQRKHSEHKFEENKLYCALCSQKFVNEKYLSEHMKTHDITEKSVSCGICLKVFTRQSKLDMHLLSHPTGQDFSCYKCTKSFKFPHHFKNHLKNEHSELVEQCKFCVKMFKDVKQLNSHMKTHRAKCKICSKYLPSIGDLNKHIAKIHSCEYCCKKFHCMEDYDEHMKERLCGPVDKSALECRYCRKKFNGNQSLTRHLVIHSDERPFNCDFCFQMFKRKDHLLNHLKNLHKVQVSNDLKEKIKRRTRK